MSCTTLRAKYYPIPTLLVSGCLALALMLLLRICARGCLERVVAALFFLDNGGLVGMLVLGLIPNGLSTGVLLIIAHARSAEVISSPWMRWTV